MIQTKIQKLIAVVAISLLVASMAFAQGKQDFTCITTPAWRFTSFLFLHTTSTNGKRYSRPRHVADGESVEIHFSRKETAKLWT